MTATEVYRRSALRRRAVDFTVSFVLVLGLALAFIGFLSGQARAGLGCATRSITTMSGECGAADLGTAAPAPAEVRVVFEADPVQPGR